MTERDIWIFYSFISKERSVSLIELIDIPLSVFDVHRIEKMRKTEDRNRSIVGRLLLQKAMENLNISKDAIYTIEWDKFMKPFIKVIYPFQFNISHSEQCVVCALTSGKVGIDVEKIDCGIDINDFEGVFSKKELDCIYAFSTPYRQLYKLWTLKECILKAKGTGFLTSPTKIRTLDNPVKIDGESFYTHHTFMNDYSLAVATPFPAKKVHLRRISLSE